MPGCVDKGNNWYQVQSFFFSISDACSFQIDSKLTKINTVSTTPICLTNSYCLRLATKAEEAKGYSSTTYQQPICHTILTESIGNGESYVFPLG